MAQAIQERNAELICEEAVSQVQVGAHTLDVNCGTLPAEAEPDALVWLVQTVQSGGGSASMPQLLTTNNKPLQTMLTVASPQRG